jgi:DNA-binding CsgD family transcriptional regulator
VTIQEFSNQNLSELIGRIYDCTLDPARWDATLHAIKDLLRCTHAFLHLDDLITRRSMVSRSAGIEPQWLERQAEMASDVAGILARVLDSGHLMDEPSVASRFMSSSELAASPYALEWGRPQGLVDYMDFFSRHQDYGNFTDREIALGRLLMPHLRRAVTICNALEVRTIEKARLMQTLDALKLGVVLANKDSRILHANFAAKQMMRNGGPLRDVGGVLRAEGAAASAEIDAAIRLAARDETGIGKTGVALRLTGEDEPPVIAHVLPLAGSQMRTKLDPDAVAAVFINAAVDDATSAQTIAATFRLTPAETRVLTRVLSGKTLAETSVHLGVAHTTARTHLDSIFAKTGASRQSELIRLAAQLAPQATRADATRLNGSSKATAGPARQTSNQIV